MIMEASNIANGNVRFNEGRRKLRFRAAEATKLIEQQMYLFGRDVLHPRGNLLRAYGCTAGKLPGQKHHIRVYLHAAPGMLVTLHSTGMALVLTDDAGDPLVGERAMLYLRPHHALFSFDPLTPPPLPCANVQQVLPTCLKRILFTEMPVALCAMLRWIREYETWCVQQVGHRDRWEGYKDYRKVPHAMRWIPPDESLRWLQSLPLERGNPNIPSD